MPARAHTNIAIGSSTRRSATRSRPGLIQQKFSPDLGELGDAGAPARDDLLEWLLLLDLPSERGRAGKNVDGHLVVLVFVRRIAPFEAIRRRTVTFAEQRHARLHRQ